VQGNRQAWLIGCLKDAGEHLECRGRETRIPLALPCWLKYSASALLWTSVVIKRNDPVDNAELKADQGETDGCRTVAR
jgi:hypothetical protein